MARIPKQTKNGFQKIIPDTQSIPTNVSSALLCCDFAFFVFFLGSSRKSPNMSISSGQNPTKVPENHDICDATIPNPFLQSSQVRFCAAILDLFYFFTARLKCSGKSPNISISNFQNPHTVFLIKISFLLAKTCKHYHA